LPTRDPDCIFCKIVAREAPASIVDEDDTTIAFLDIRPVNPGHTLVIPRSHAARLSGLPSRQGGEAFAAAMRVAAAIRSSGIRCEGINLYLADGEAAGQEVDHVHLHVVPRFTGDGFGLRFGPQYGRIAARAELDEMAAKIRRKMTTHGTNRF